MQDAIISRGGQVPGAARGMPGVGIHDFREPYEGFNEEEEEARLEELNFLDSLEQLLGQQAQQQQQQHIGHGGGHYNRAPKAERGLYQPISEASGQQRPSMIPRAPGAAGPATSFGGAANPQQPPRSRMGGSFFNLEGGGGAVSSNQQMKQQQQSKVTRAFATSSARPPRREDPAILVSAGGAPPQQAKQRFSSARKAPAVAEAPVASGSSVKKPGAAVAGRRAPGGGGRLTSEPPARPGPNSGLQRPHPRGVGGGATEDLPNGKGRPRGAVEADDPKIKAMAEQIANDPAFKEFTRELSQSVASMSKTMSKGE